MIDCSLMHGFVKISNIEQCKKKKKKLRHMLRIFFPWGYGEQSIFNEMYFFFYQMCSHCRVKLSGNHPGVRFKKFGLLIFLPELVFSALRSNLSKPCICHCS